MNKATLRAFLLPALIVGAGAVWLLLSAMPAATLPAAAAINPDPPASPVKLIFIHHSTGENWLADDHGRLGLALRDNNYFVSDTNYGWGPDGIGDNTDIGHWWDWFRGPNRDAYTAALYTEYGQHSAYSRLAADPGGENEIVLFKSCFPNSHIGGNPADPPTSGDNPLRGQDAWSEYMTVANVKGIYNDILEYFAARQDKLFILIVSPPLVANETDAAHAANARAVADWLVNDWLDGYPHDNVAVFDFYNVLTSNGGDVDANDLGQESGNHHRWWNGAVQHIQTVDNDYAAYGSDAWDSHPTAAGGQKASAEFAPLLNVFYHRWRGSAGPSNWVYLPLVLKDWFAPVPTPTVACTPPACATDEVYYCPDVCPGGCGTVCATPTPTTIPRPTEPPPGGRLHPSDLTYRGAFAYPEGDEWAYSGHALAYYPSGDPGSLYAAAHTWDDLVGEISIPAPVSTTDFAALPRASALRAPADITGGWKDDCTYNDDCEYREVDGLAYLPNVDKIAWNLNDWYNVGGYDQDSLGWSDLDMSGAQGVWHIGDRPSSDDLFHNSRTSDYLFPAPQSFADAHLEGKRLIAGKHRQAGAFGGSQGPTLYALAPWEDGSPPAPGQNLDALAPWEDGSPPTPGQNLDALALVYYPEIYPGCLDNPDECYFPDYRPADDWGGGAWVQTANANAILIFGRKGLGDNCYGTEAECGGDPCDPYKGYHAYPYRPQILFYDPADVQAALAGGKEPWEVLPYEVYSPAAQMIGGECALLGAAAYDRETSLLYVAEREAGPDGETVVHVWGVGGQE